MASAGHILRQPSAESLLVYEHQGVSFQVVIASACFMVTSLGGQRALMYPAGITTRNKIHNSAPKANVISCSNMHFASKNTSSQKAKCNEHFFLNNTCIHRFWGYTIFCAGNDKNAGQQEIFSHKTFLSFVRKNTLLWGAMNFPCIMVFLYVKMYFILWGCNDMPPLPIIGRQLQPHTGRIYHRIYGACHSSSTPGHPAL